MATRRRLARLGRVHCDKVANSLDRISALPIRLGVLDQSPISRGEEATDAIAHTMALAKRCDELGYHRYWVAEHHASDSLASSSPEILITRLAAETERIRVGSGGVMLSHYSPYKVAENFRMLEVLYPGRIDLGVGRAPGSDGLTAAALAYGNPLGIEYYPAKVKDLIAFVNGREPLTEAFRNLKGDLAIRPIHHQLESRIEAHIFIAFVAYCMHVCLKQRCKASASGLTRHLGITRQRLNHHIRELEAVGLVRWSSNDDAVVVWSA